MCEEERDKWHEVLRRLEALVAEQERYMQQDPSPERERLLRAAQALFDKEKEELNKKEQLMFRCGHLREVKGFP
jgi:acyl-CoA reductase-like NAD-dependent aldehyde dehydrogenase